MKKREPVSHIMTKSVKTVLISESLRTVKEIFKTEGIHHLPVTKGEEIIGIISSTDLNILLLGKLFDHQEGGDESLLDTLKLEQLMTPNPVTVEASDAIRDVADVFSNANFHAIPVVEGAHIVGIVTTKDVIRYMLTQL